jgi:hypothetical protein
MINRRTALGIIASVSTIGGSGVALAKEKHHLDGHALLGDKIKQNGKHKIHKAGNVVVSASFLARLHLFYLHASCAYADDLAVVDFREDVLILASMQLAATGS